MLGNELQSPMKVICEPAHTYVHLHMRTDAYTRSICNYWSRAGLVLSYKQLLSKHYQDEIISILSILYFIY